MEVIQVSNGIANRFDDHIEINKHLAEYPELYNSILKHELAHTNNPGFTKKDFVLDLSPSNINYWKLLRFMIRHPGSFTQFLPFYKKGKLFIYDINLCIVWGAILSVVGFSVFISLRL